MRNVAVFILSLPVLALVVAGVLLTLVATVFSGPVWGALGLIATLRGEDPHWEVFIIVPLTIINVYLGITGFCPRLKTAIERL